MAKMITKNKEFTFTEWQNLPFEAKRDIWNNYWNQYEPNAGQQTRIAIITEFRQTYPEIAKDAIAIGYGYFGWGVGCIYVIVSNSSAKVPKKFASIIINKGIYHKQVDRETILVSWRDVGGSNSLFKLNLANAI
jgi:hypothetical protein